MMSLSLPQLIGLLISILGIAGLALYSGMRRQSYANVNPSPIIAGIIMGTLVGGSSTVGTAQLAYNYGLSAWWFTLGGGLACLVLALFYTVPWRKSGSMTLIGIIRNEFGSSAGMLASLLSSVGTFINIISQLISGTAVIAVVAPTLGLVPALIITAAFMALYVVVGGSQGAGLVGILKLALLYVSMVGCGIMVLVLCGGFSGFSQMVAAIQNPEGINFYNLFARGVGKDGGAALSLILGVLTTQTYAQAVLSGKSDKEARKGALISAVLIPPIGIGGILVGLYMRANYPGIAAKTALTAFATQHLPPLLSGLLLGTLFIAVVGTGAGLAMGISTIVHRDILCRFSDRMDDPKYNNILSKIIIVLILALGVCLSAGSLGDTILSFAFMSMGLRGAVVFVPMCCALWLPGKVNRGCALAGIVAGPVAVLLFGTVLSLPYGIDPLFAGIAAALLCCVVGLAVGNRSQARTIRVLHSPLASSPLPVIAVDSELCSGGAEIAHELAKALRVPCYDGEEILSVAAECSGISEKLLRRYDERGVVVAYDMQAGDETALRLVPNTGVMIAAQMEACRKLAVRGPCVLVDHFASKTLRDSGCITIFVHADLEKRAAAYAEESGLGPATARKRLKAQDRTRARYYRSADRHWGADGKYTISVNATDADYAVLADSLSHYLYAVARPPKKVAVG